jgi:hypothetical protein
MRRTKSGRNVQNGVQIQSETRVTVRVAVALWMIAVTAARADAKLENFGAPAAERVAGEYGILFKKPPALRQLPTLYASRKGRVKKPTVLPDTLPLTAEDTNTLAAALAGAVGGQAFVITPSTNDGEQGMFFIKRTSDAAVKRLAKDPRIDVIAASTYTHPTVPAIPVAPATTSSDPHRAPTPPPAPNQ